ncbi:hypothetical protein [Novosphingobium ovatum]|uniref:hypothetical protein n=1 Tax=Novosphingobium ovatum TaxID=1908523 RepID=UPI00191C3BFE|nr:hypothetical protein [Novosphingobium ovatum]
MTTDSHVAAHLLTVSDILLELASEIEELGTALCIDPDIMARHISALQSIDLIAQKQRWLSTLLRADCPVAAAGSIDVEALKARFAPPPTH